MDCSDELASALERVARWGGSRAADDTVTAIPCESSLRVVRSGAEEPRSSVTCRGTLAWSCWGGRYSFQGVGSRTAKPRRECACV